MTPDSSYSGFALGSSHEDHETKLPITGYNHDSQAIRNPNPPNPKMCFKCLGFPCWTATIFGPTSAGDQSYQSESEEIRRTLRSWFGVYQGFFWGVGLIHLRLEDPQRLIATGHMPHCQLPPHGKGYLLTGAICKDGRLTQLSADIVRMVEGHSMGVIFGLYPKQSHSPS